MDLSKLAADGTCSPESVQKAIRDLKRMARFGRMAESALSQIKEKGWVEGKFPAATISHNYGELKIGSHYLEATVAPTRSMVPDFTDLKVTLGKLDTDSHGGTEFSIARVNLSGTGFAQVGREIMIRQFTEKAGCLRLKKDGGISYRTNHFFSHPLNTFVNNGKVVKIYSEFKSANAIESAKSLAADFTIAMSVCDDKNPSQLYNDLMKSTQQWLVEEGHIKRLSLELRDAARVLGVMSA